MPVPALTPQPGKAKHRLERLTDHSEVLGFVKGYTYALSHAVSDTRITKRTQQKMMDRLDEICAAMRDPSTDVEIPTVEDLWKIIDNEMEKS